MNPEDVYRKTPLGQEEIQRRRFGLSARERRVLILIDGRKTLAELDEVLINIEDFPDIVQRLGAAGLIVAEVSGAGSASGTRPAFDPLGNTGSYPSVGGRYASGTRPALDRVGGTGPQPAAAGTGTGSRRAIDFDAAVRELADRIFAELGPDGGALIMQLSQCRTPKQVLTHMAYVRNYFHEYLGASHAEEIWRRAQALLGERS